MSDRRKSIPKQLRLAIVELYQNFLDLSDIFLAKCLGFLNSLLYRVARAYQGLTAGAKQDKKPYQANPHAIPFLIDCLGRGDEIALPFTAISNYQEAYWQNLPNSRSTILRICDFFQDLGLLKRDRGALKPGVRKTQPFYDIDFLGLLAAANCCEQELKARGWDFREPAADGQENFEIDFENKLFPSHHFATLYLLGQACGIRWCRKEKQLTQAEVFGDEETEEEPTPDFDDWGYAGTAGLETFNTAPLGELEDTDEVFDDEMLTEEFEEDLEPVWEGVAAWLASSERDEPDPVPVDPRDELPI